MATSFRRTVREENQVGDARRAVNELCVRLGGDQTFCGRASLVITELARNLVLHAGGGEIVFRELLHPTHAGVEVLALDRGPGMHNVGECLRDGYSTAGTPGTGLGAVRRLADFFDMSTTVGRGTAICARLLPRGGDGRGPRLRVGAVSVAVAGEELCGDSWEVIGTSEAVRVLVADGLGHGAFAAEASREAVAVFRAHPDRELGEVLGLIHDALQKTRGAAAAIAEVQFLTKSLNVSGVGNISVHYFDAEGKSRQMGSVNGTLGAKLPKVQEFSAPWPAGGLLVLHSDGLTAAWSLEAYPGLLQRDPAVIAGIIYRDFSRERDDATVVVISCAP
jgi:anti-sigma regulatory factor (Ser/Thr protein kinase)